MKDLLFLVVTVPAAALLLSGCVDTRFVPAWFSTIREPIAEEEIIRLPQGEKISFADLLKDLGESQVIFIGESHDQTHHHAIELRIMEALRGRAKGLAVGMEMFSRAQQPVLDLWSQGALTREAFIKDVQWHKNWGMNYDLYQGVLDAVKEYRLKLLGLNVDHDLVRQVAERGVKGIPPEERRKLPDMDLRNAEHRAYLRTIFKGHGSGAAKDFERFYEAQALWDEAMAESIARFLQSPEGINKTVLVLCGSGHIAFDFGIPGRLYRRIPVSYTTIILKQWAKETDHDILFKDTRAPLADFLWVTRPNPPEKKKPRIGVIFARREDQRLIIERVLPGAPAEKAGLLPGDELIAVEGMEITGIKDVHHALAERGWGKEIRFTITRNGQEKEIAVLLPPEEA